MDRLPGADIRKPLKPSIKGEALDAIHYLHHPDSCGFSKIRHNNCLKKKKKKTVPVTCTEMYVTGA